MINLRSIIQSLIKIWHQYFLIKRSGLFDTNYYVQNYPEIKEVGLSPTLHFIKFGWREGKNPSSLFNTAYYLRENKDVRKFGINPLVHYIQFGIAEERPPNSSLSTDPFTYSSWIDQFDTLTPNDISKIHAHTKTLELHPLISILIPVYNTPESFLQEALKSVLSQTYQNWECCIADDGSTSPHVHKILEKFRKSDPRFKIIYRETNGHISAASNTALSIASGDYVGLLDHDDVLRDHALYMIVNEINHHPDAEILYCDEDLIDEFGVRYDPYFKPDWNPDLFTGHNLITHFGVFRTNRVREAGGFRLGYEGAQDWDLSMRLSEMVPEASIRHIPFILYHWRAVIGSTALSSKFKKYAQSAQWKTLQSHFERISQPVDISQTKDDFWRIIYLIPEKKPLVSIIIPTRNEVEILEQCINSIIQKTHYLNYEILIINNNSDEEDTIAYLDKLKNHENIRVIEFNQPFNYSAINNFAADQSNGEFLLFLNNDTEVISPNWLDEMIGHALRPQIGAVGAMLYYPNDTIQHAGVILGMKGIAGHIYYGSPRGSIGQRGRLRLVQNFSAITAACMAVEKKKFYEINGFNEKQLPIAYNDIDFCLRLIESGYRIVWTPHAELYHHESTSRQYEDTAEKITRLKSEASYLVNTWGETITNDPAYNPNLSLDIPDFSLAFPPRVQKPWLGQSNSTNYLTEPL